MIILLIKTVIIVTIKNNENKITMKIIMIIVLLVRMLKHIILMI